MHWLPAIEVHKKNIAVRKGQSIFREGDPVTGIFFVYKGTVKVHKSWDAEKELITRFAREGDIIGHLGLGDEPLYPVSATALEPSVVCYLHMDFFESTLKVNADLTYNLMLFFANELQGSQKSMRDLAHMSVRARIAQALLSLLKQFGLRGDGSVNIEISRQDIASYAGASYETLFKVINELTSNKIVELTGRRIQILDRDKLSDIIERDNL